MFWWQMTTPPTHQTRVREIAKSTPQSDACRKESNAEFGPSYRDGFPEASAEPWCKGVFTMDADLSDDPVEIRNWLDS
jgi:hypothetical protein